MNEIIQERITDWSLKKIWNEATLPVPREVKPREYCWASELYRPLIDRYLAMTGTQPTNPPNERSRRKFLAGMIMEEIQGIVIATLGLKVDRQEEVWTRGIIHVKGKIDFLIQGKPDYEKARYEIKKLGFSQDFLIYLTSIVNSFEQKIGDAEFAPIVRESKSCSEYVIDMIQGGGKIIGHQLQLYHYLLGMGLPLGYVDYLSKNDLQMEEARVVCPDADLQARYDDDLIKLDGYLKAGQRPPQEPLIVFEDGKFKKNILVEYCNYLTLVYQFERPDQYADSVKSRVASWNRVLGRIKAVNAGEETKTGKKVILTDKNKLAIDEIEKMGWNAYELAAKAADISEEEE